MKTSNIEDFNDVLRAYLIDNAHLIDGDFEFLSDILSDNVEGYYNVYIDYKQFFENDTSVVFEVVMDMNDCDNIKIKVCLTDLLTWMVTR